MANEKTMTIKLVKSLAGITKKQISVVKSLGLHKVGDVTEQPATPVTEGKVFKVSHLVEVIKR